MARIEDIERRLLNWARWKAGGQSGGLGYSAMKWAASVGDQGRYRESVIPTVDCEASETEAALMALPSELRRTVEVVYLQGGGMAAKARRLAVTEATVYSRVEQAHRHLDRYLAEQDRARREQRARVEALQAAARP